VTVEHSNTILWLRYECYCSSQTACKLDIFKISNSVA